MIFSTAIIFIHNWEMLSFSLFIKLCIGLIEIAEVGTSEKGYNLFYHWNTVMKLYGKHRTTLLFAQSNKQRLFLEIKWNFLEKRRCNDEGSWCSTSRFCHAVNEVLSSAVQSMACWRDAALVNACSMFTDPAFTMSHQACFGLVSNTHTPSLPLLDLHISSSARSNTPKSVSLCRKIVLNSQSLTTKCYTPHLGAT